MIVIKELSKVYGDKICSVKALDKISLKIDKGDFVAIVGTSGSGKSTLLNILGGLDKQTSGEYILDNEELSNLKDKKLAYVRNEKIGFIFQSFNLLNEKTVLENVLVPFKLRKGYNFFKLKEGKNKAIELLKKLNMEEYKNQMPYRLSGGQQQRVAIARALINDPEMILADEPTGALDTKSGEIVMDIFKKINKEGKTVIVITHDINIANKCNKVITIQDGALK